MLHVIYIYIYTCITDVSLPMLAYPFRGTDHLFSRVFEFGRNLRRSRPPEVPVSQDHTTYIYISLSIYI